MSKLKYYVFIGQNATTGTPNPNSGNLSVYGDLKSFHTLESRNEFFNNFHSNNSSMRIWKTNKQSARLKFFGGMTQNGYNDYLDQVRSGYISISRYL